MATKCGHPVPFLHNNSTKELLKTLFFMIFNRFWGRNSFRISLSMKNEFPAKKIYRYVSILALSFILFACDKDGSFLSTSPQLEYNSSTLNDQQALLPGQEVEINLQAKEGNAPLELLEISRSDSGIIDPSKFSIEGNDETSNIEANPIVLSGGDQNGFLWNITITAPEENNEYQYKLILTDTEGSVTQVTFRISVYLRTVPLSEDTTVQWEIGDFSNINDVGLVWNNNEDGKVVIEPDAGGKLVQLDSTAFDSLNSYHQLEMAVENKMPIESFREISSELPSEYNYVLGVRTITDQYFIVRIEETTIRGVEEDKDVYITATYKTQTFAETE